MSPAIRVLLADHDAPVRAGVRIALGGAGIDVCAEAADAASAISITRQRPADVCLLAADLPGGALVVLRTLVAAEPPVKTVVLTECLEDDEFLEVIRAGAVGYLGKGMAVERLAAVVRAVASGEAAVPRSFAAVLIDEVHGRQRLRSVVQRHARTAITDREWQVLHLLAERLPTAVIAGRLGIAEVTVRRHASSLVSKLGVADREAAVELLRSAA